MCKFLFLSNDAIFNNGLRIHEKKLKLKFFFDKCFLHAFFFSKQKMLIIKGGNLIGQRKLIFLK